MDTQNKTPIYESSVRIRGYAGDKPKIIFTANNKQLASFTVATKTGIKNAFGTYDNITHWHRVLCVNADLLTTVDHIGKGDYVELTGQLEYEKYTDKNGQERLSSVIKLLFNHTVKILKKNTDKPEEPVSASAETELDDAIPF